jgi:hypothetical protein
LLTERLKKMLLGGGLARPAFGERVPDAPDAAYARHSHGLEQFLSQLRDRDSLSILDIGGVSQANVSFITSLGHKLYSEGLLRTEQPGGELASAAVETFLRQNLDFPEARFDGVLLWDVLEFLPPPLLKATVDRLFKIAKPGSYLLAFFHAEEKATSVPLYSYRISDSKSLMLVRREMRRPSQLFNNRSVEKLFHQFQSVKFFLTRDHLREVIVRR